jgi:hypothetical protein
VICCLCEGVLAKATQCVPNRSISWTNPRRDVPGGVGGNGGASRGMRRGTARPWHPGPSRMRLSGAGRGMRRDAVRPWRPAGAGGTVRRLGRRAECIRGVQSPDGCARADGPQWWPAPSAARWRAAVAARSVAVAVRRYVGEVGEMEERPWQLGVWLPPRINTPCEEHPNPNPSVFSMHDLELLLGLISVLVSLVSVLEII